MWFKARPLASRLRAAFPCSAKGLVGEQPEITLRASPVQATLEIWTQEDRKLSGSTPTIHNGAALAQDSDGRGAWPRLAATSRFCYARNGQKRSTRMRFRSLAC